jgi:hypothetical protein
MNITYADKTKWLAHSETFKIWWVRLLGGLLLLAYCGCGSAEQQAKQLRWKWVYFDCNFQVNEQVDELISLMHRAKKAGYNGMVITDSKWGRFQGRPAQYYYNLKRAKREADLIGIEIIPGVMHIGYSNSILVNNPNLAEGIAVKDCVFIVNNGKATVANSKNYLPFGGLEEASGNRPSGWDLVDGPGRSVFHDQIIKHTGDASVRMENYYHGNIYGNCRLSKKLTLLPWHQYKVSLFIKTKNVDSPEKIKVAVTEHRGRELSYSSINVKRTQDWNEHEVVFNTLENSVVSIYIGAWGVKTGKIWIDDVSLRETAGINLLRRKGCPVKVTSMDGKTVYIEDKDYEKWYYPKLGKKRWIGDYHITHPEPPIYIKKGSAIREGQRLKVSFYHTLVINTNQVCCCLSHEELFGYFEQQVRQVKKYFEAKKFFMNYDEIRIAGQCELCKRPDKTAGQLLAENVRRCVEIIRNVEPEAEIFVWSDMFDPFHNARDNYYLVDSTLEGSWEGLEPSVCIVNWNRLKVKNSVRFFSERGHKQVISCCIDIPDMAEKIGLRLNTTKDVEGVEGFMYTTWHKNYKDLEKFLLLVNAR